MPQSIVFIFDFGWLLFILISEFSHFLLRNPLVNGSMPIFCCASIMAFVVAEVCLILGSDAVKNAVTSSITHSIISAGMQCCCK